MTSSPIAIQPAQLIRNSLSKCVISLLSALRMLQTVQSHAKDLANSPVSLGGHSLSHQNYRLASGGISSGLMLVPLLLVFYSSSKSIATVDTGMLSDV